MVYSCIFSRYADKRDIKESFATFIVPAAKYKVILGSVNRMNEMNQKLIDEACELFILMIHEEDRDKRVNLKIEINDICLRGKFDYFNSVYTPMVASMKAANGKC